MNRWPVIAEAELVERLGMSDESFGAAVGKWFAMLGPREYERAQFDYAIAYPWERPARSYVLRDADVAILDELTPPVRATMLERFADRIRLLAIGSNAAPERLRMKFAHFDDPEDRAVAVLAGHLQDFDVGVAAHPAMYGAMPATLFPSPGTAVRTAVLLVTPTQFTQLVWSELTYRLGHLAARFEADEPELNLDGILAFVSRFGAFRVDGRPAALAAIPARGRTAPELTQEQMLDAAARLAIGPDAAAEDLVRAVFEDFGAFIQALVAVRAAGEPFESAAWTPYSNPAT